MSGEAQGTLAAAHAAPDTGHHLEALRYLEMRRQGVTREWIRRAAAIAVVAGFVTGAALRFVK
jgi:hypothetical protein